MSAAPTVIRTKNFVTDAAAFIIEQARMVLVWGRVPDLQGLAVYLLVASAIAWGGYAWFQQTKKGFADVL